jgi:probable phosphoglycerate mutase
MLRLYFLRHGETAPSRDGRYCGQLDAPLTDAGHEIAEAFAARYGDIQWRAIYASDKQRTYATALPVAKLVGRDIVQNAALTEVSYGAWEGLTHAEASSGWPEEYRLWKLDPGGRGTPGGETAYQVAARAMPFIDTIRDRHAEGDVLVVSHKTTIRIITSALLGIDARLGRDRFDVPIGSLTLFEIGDHGPHMRLFGDRSHLPIALQKLEGP